LTWRHGHLEVIGAGKKPGGKGGGEEKGFDVHGGVSL
jgi:hypothetical protein